MCDDSSYLEGTGRKIRNLRPAQAKLAKLYLKKAESGGIHPKSQLPGRRR
jgi:hypothetical protein